MRMGLHVRGLLALGLLWGTACTAASTADVAAGNTQYGQLIADAGADASSGWTTVGSGDAGAIAPGAAYSGRVAVSAGIPYAIFPDYANSGKLTVMKLSGGKWTAVGVAGFTSESTYYYTLYVDAGTPYVAYVGSSTYKLTVMKYNGSAWVVVGTAGFAATSGYGIASLAVSNGTPYVAFVDATSQLLVMVFNGSAWTVVGGGPFSTSGSSCAMTIFNGAPYVACTDYTTSSVTKLVTHNGTAWVLVAQVPYTIDEDYGQDLSVSNGALYLTFYNYTYGAVVLKLTGSTLVSVGALGSISNGAYIEYLSGAVYNGTPYVAYDDEDRDSDPQPKAATVKYFDGKTWQLYAGYANPCDIEDTFIAADQTTGQIYFTYSDCNGYMTVQVH